MFDRRRDAKPARVLGPVRRRVPFLPPRPEESLFSLDVGAGRRAKPGAR